MKWNFNQNKIFGHLGESVCESTFGMLGFDVEKTGIEMATPFLTSNLKRSSQKVSQTYGKEVVDSLRRTPDFIVSRVNKNFVTEVMYVEAKFRYCSSYTDLVKTQEGLRQKLVENSTHNKTTLIFLVTNPIAEMYSEPNCVWLLYSRHPENWVSARSSGKFSIFRADNGQSLSSIVANDIDPVIKRIFA